MFTIRSIDPPLGDGFSQLLCVTPQELFESVQISLTGLSSPLYVWDVLSQGFVLRGAGLAKIGPVVINGMSEITSERSVVVLIKTFQYS